MLSFVSAAAFATPQIIRVDGMIYDNAGSPYAGSPSITVSAFAASTGGAALWTSHAYTPTVTNGKFTIDMDGSYSNPAQTLSQAIAAQGTGASIWFEISYAGNIVRPRIRARGTAFAVSASTADAIQNIPVSTATPGANNVLSYSGGTWGPTSVTSLVSGSYLALSGGTMSGNLSLPALTLSAASVNVSSLSATHLVRADASGNLVSVTAAVADSDIANIAGTTANIQTQLNSKLATLTQSALSGTGAVSVSNAPNIIGGTAAVISITTATASSNGVLTSTDWNTFNNKQSAFASQSSSLFLAGPTSGSAVPTFRGIASSDLPVMVGATTGVAGTAGAVPAPPASDQNYVLLGNGTWGAIPGEPAGTISAWGGTSAPTGWLMCDGSSYVRASYPDLFSAIGTAYGAADGTHFNVPDFRGRFLRGVDGGAGNDPDTASRTAMNSGGNTGNSVGSVQADELTSHTHTYTSSTWSGVYSPSGAFNGVFVPSAGAITAATGGNETRPKNGSVNFIIKYTPAAAGGAVTTAMLNTYMPLSGSTMSGTLTAPTLQDTGLTPSAAVVTDGSSNLASSTTTSTQIAYLSNVNADVQGQFNWTKPVVANAGLSAAVASNALTINLVAEDGNAPSAIDPVYIKFRSATATLGTNTMLAVTSALSITIPSGTTLGTINNDPQYISVYALNNAGTVALGVSVDEFKPENILQTTTAVSGGTSNTTLYTTTALTSVPIRYLGKIKVPQTTAGTWATAPTLVYAGPRPSYPITDWYSAGAVAIGAVTTAPTKGTTSNDNMIWRRNGASMDIQYTYSQTAAGAGGSGAYLLPIPAGYQVDNTKVSVNTFAGASTQASNLGVAYTMLPGIGGGTGFVFANDVSHLGIIAMYTNGGSYANWAGVGSSYYTLANTSLSYSFSVTVPIAGWSTGN